MFHFLWIVLLSNFQGENPSWRESTMERVVLERIHPGESQSGENPPWRESTLEGTHPGESNSGDNPPWRESTLEGIHPGASNSGENPPWSAECWSSLPAHPAVPYIVSHFFQLFSQLFLMCFLNICLVLFISTEENVMWNHLPKQNEIDRAYFMFAGFGWDMLD